jgi:predicted small lipoprotein YifL
MSASRKVSITALAAVFVLSGALAGCGKMGELERPAPLWGAKEKAKYDAEKRAAAATAHKPSKPGSVQENADPATSTATTRQSPQKGSNPDPFGGPSGPGFPNSGPQ